MTVLDYFVLIVVLASVASGLRRGILKGIISIVSAVAGLLAAAQFYGYAAVLFRSVGLAELEANIAGFAAVFLLVLIAGSLLARWLQRGVKRARLNWADRALGGAFGLVRGWLICSAVYMAITAFSVKLDAVERATFAPVLLRGTRVIAYLTSSQFREQFLKGYEAVQSVWGKKN